MFAINEEPQLQIQLAHAIESMNMQQARMLILDQNIVPQIGLHGLEERSLFLLIRNAAALSDKLLLRRLSYYHSSLSAKVLWNILDTSDNIEMATNLVLSGAKLSVRREDQSWPTFLHVLSASDDPRRHQLAELMIDRGADVSDIDSNKRSVLYYAINGGAPQDFIRKLIDYSGDRFAKNAIDIAVSDRCAELMPLLFRNGAPGDITISRRARDAIYDILHMDVACTVEAIEILLKYHMPMDVFYGNDFTPLQRMVVRANVEVVRLLLLLKILI